MLARLSAFVIWSLVAATAVFWALRFTARPLQTPPYAVAVGKAAPIRGDLTRLFGAAPIVAVLPEAAAPEASGRFKLVGVMAPRSAEAQSVSGRGLALIAVDGKPARAFAVGSRLDSDLVLQSVSLRTASIGPAQGARSVLLELPVLPAPATGTLPAPGGPSAMAAQVPAIAMRGQPVPAMAAPVAPVPLLPAPPVMQPAMTPQPVLPAAAVPAAPPPPNDNFRSQ